MVIQKRTRQEIRQSIGYNLGALHIGVATSTGSATQLNDTLLFGGNDIHNGKYLWFYNDAAQSTIRELERRISDFVSGGTVTLQTLPATTTSSDKYELWDGYSPTMINEFINQAILDVTGHAYDPVESLSLHSDRYNSRFDLPSDFAMINKIQIRDKMQWTSVHTCNAAFDEQSTIVVTTLDGAITSTTSKSVPVDSTSPLRADQQIMVGSEKMTIDSISSNTLTVSRGAGGTTAATHSDGASVLLFPIIDTKDKKPGGGSNKFIIPAAASAGQIATDSITSLNISRYDYLEFWIKSTVATSAGNLKILLDDTASCASPIETLSVPALSADTWAYTRIALANPETDTAIVSVGLEYDSDLGACTVWLDDIKAVANDTITWKDVPSQLWRVDKVAQDIVFTTDGVTFMGYNLLKIKGGDKPALLTSDSATSEIDDGYVINKATALSLSSMSGGPATDPDARRQQAAFYYGMSEQNKRAFPFLVNVRAAS